MSLSSLIRQRREGILQRWTDEVVATYEAKSATFLKNQRDRFLNPVGHAIRNDLARMLDLLIGENGETNGSLPTELIKIRAVQDFKPSQALAFVFLLKNVINDELAVELGNQEIQREYGQLCQRIDTMALTCFDSYMDCREQLGQIKINEFKRRYQKLLDSLDVFEIDGNPNKG